ncbi:MAG: polymer-forming cytoskeletal protein [Alphaproteobacteria bacterium]|nr:polymer-forming cytoskeletal protein [Alphaproteobacteria bacterium]
MFSKDTKDTPKGAVKVPSIISANLRIVGDLVSEGDVQVDGVVEGDVRARSLTLSEGAVVKGQIDADEVRIRGTVEGQISAAHVELGRTARVSGDVLHDVLAIEAGAFIDGHCRHKPDGPRVALPGPGPQDAETDRPAAVSL